jgi:hypothetical protein
MDYDRKTDSAERRASAYFQYADKFPNKKVIIDTAPSSIVEHIFMKSILKRSYRL